MRSAAPQGGHAPAGACAGTSGVLSGLPLIGDRVPKKVEKEFTHSDPIQVVVAREGVPQVPLTIIKEIRPIGGLPLDGVCRNPQGVETILHLRNEGVGESGCAMPIPWTTKTRNFAPYNLPNKDPSGVSGPGDDGS